MPVCMYTHVHMHMHLHIARNISSFSIKYRHVLRVTRNEHAIYDTLRERGIQTFKVSIIHTYKHGYIHAHDQGTIATYRCHELQRCCAVCLFCPRKTEIRHFCLHRRRATSHKRKMDGGLRHTNTRWTAGYVTQTQDGLRRVHHLCNL